MPRRRIYIRYALVLAALIIASGCCCKSYEDPYTLGAPPPGLTAPGVLHAGAAKVEITPAIGVPLAGYSGRRLSFPNLNPFNYHTYFKPSDGILEPLYARSLVLDNGSERVCIVVVDGCASDGEVVELAHRKAAAKGFSIPLEKVLFCSSHTHSGPGAMTKKRLLIFAAADRCVNKVREEFTSSIADSMVQAEQNMFPVSVGITTVSLTGVTKNRRGDYTDNYDESHVDDQLGIISVDKKDGTALATIWNYAIHGTKYRPSNLKYSPDNMGAVSTFVEQNDGGIALFINGPEGDIAPKGSIADITDILGNEIIENRPEPVNTSDWLELKTAYEIVNFGNPRIDDPLQRILSMEYGELEFTEFLEEVGVTSETTLILDSSWLENEFRFQAIRIGKTLLSSVPGEPIYDIGLIIRDNGVDMGYDNVFICALANNHMGYITTEEEYDEGGYESFFTMFGSTTGENVTNACKRVADVIKP
jgi:hypothetical protein